VRRTCCPGSSTTGTSASRSGCTARIPLEAALRGTPAAVDALVAAFRPPALVRRDGDRWSAQEHVGHLIAVRAAVEKRISELRRRRDAAHAADMNNRLTAAADLNRLPIATSLRRSGRPERRRWRGSTR